MASSSKRSTRLSSIQPRSKTFRTVVSPNQENIQICPFFRDAWHNELFDHPWAKLLHPTGKSVMLDLKINHPDSYMTNGKIVCLLFGFREPTQVNLRYLIEDNGFTLSLYKDDDLINISSGDEADEVDISETHNYTLWDHDNDRVFGWELEVSDAYADDTKEQVLHIPKRTAESVLRERKSIYIRTLHNMDNIKCTLITYTTKKNKKVMYLTQGWFQFQKANSLQKGDKLKFQLSDPPEVLVVEIVRKPI